MPAGGDRAQRWLRWLKRDTDSPAAPPRLERESLRPPRALDPDPGAAVICPACEAQSGLGGFSCEACGFPFICDIAGVPQRGARQHLATWRRYAGVLAAALWLIGSTLFTQSSEEFQGYTTKVVSTVAADTDSGITISGPEAAVRRTQLALGLIEQRAPDYYFRMRANIKEIAYLPQSYLEGPEGRKITLEGIGALATPEQRLVQALYITIFPSGMDNLYDRDVYSYAGVLVHELRHIELHAMGTAPGGWQEEVLCEEAAYDALKHMDAPDGVLLRYELYLRDPQAGQYQHWYKWYDQWE